MLEKPVMFPAPESNGFIKKISYTAQSLVLQEVFLVYAVCTLLLCFGCFFPSGQSFAEFLLAYHGECLDLVQCVWEF